MLLIENGKLTLNDSIQNYLPNLPHSWCDITILHLLTATSGIKDYINELQLNEAQIKSMNHQLLNLLLDEEVNFLPGEQWAYNNTGFIILAYIVELVSGLTYNTFLEDNFFNHIKCKICQNNLQKVISNRVSGYLYEEVKWSIRQPTFTGKQSFGDGELIASIEDMAKWSLVWSGDKFLKKTSRKQIWMPSKLNNGTYINTSINSNYGLGCFLSNDLDSNRYWIPGSGEGFSTSYMYFPDDNTTIIVLTNLGEFLLADSIAFGVKRLL
jgi:CubicO group peptidase (beta-lactamase class C family)